MASAALLALAARWPSHFAWTATLTLVPLFAVTRVYRPRSAGLLGMLWGGSLGAFLFWSGGPAGGSSFAYGLAVCVAAGAFSAAASALTRWIGFRPIALALAWTLFELAVAPLGPRLGVLGAAMDDGGVFSGALIAFGYVAAAFLAAYVSAYLVLAVCKVSCPKKTYRFASKPTKKLRSLVNSIRQTIFPHIIPARGPPDHAFALITN
jgi:hypothetical protein